MLVGVPVQRLGAEDVNTIFDVLQTAEVSAKDANSVEKCGLWADTILCICKNRQLAHYSNMSMQLVQDEKASLKQFCAIRRRLSQKSISRHEEREAEARSEKRTSSVNSYTITPPDHTTFLAKTTS